MMQTSYKYLGISVIAITLFSGCSSGSSSSLSSTSGSSMEATNISVMFGSVDSSANLNTQVASKASLPPGFGVVYSIPVFNTSASDTLSVSSQSVSNYGAHVWSVESVVSSSCQNIAPGNNCLLQVGFNAANVESAAQLSSVLTINYSNGNSSGIPLSGAIIAAGGYTNESNNVGAEVYQYMGNGIWTPTGLSSVAQGVAGSSVTSMTVSNGILCVGGSITTESGTVVGQVWQYNSESSVWNILIESGIDATVASLISQ